MLADRVEHCIESHIADRQIVPRVRREIPVPVPVHPAVFSMRR